MAGRACWTCRGWAGEGEFCPTCGVIQPPDPAQDPFARLGVARGYEVDLPALEADYRQRQQRLHPDRFATRSATERRLSLEWVTGLNEAYQTLCDPVRRSEALLALVGYRQPAAGHDANFLLAVMELRERLEEAKGAPALQALRDEVGALKDGELATIAHAWRSYFGMGEDEGRLAVIARHVARLRYFDRFMLELERAEEQLW